MLGPSGALRLPNCPDAAADEQSRQLRRFARQRLPLACRQGRSAGCRDLPGLRGAPKCLSTANGAVAGVATGDMGIGKDGHRKPEFHARHGATREIHADRRRRARHRSTKAPDRAVRSRRRPRAAKIRHRHQGALGGRPAMHRPGLVQHTFGWPLDNSDRRRLVPLSFRR